MIGAFPLPVLVDMPCPIGRTFGIPHGPCQGDRCPLLRQMPMVCDPAWAAAVKAVAAEIDDKSPGRAKAAQIVAANPEAHGLERLFYCGLGGKARMTRAEKHACAVRELAMRRRSYPRWVAIGRMTPGDAEREIALMEAIVEDYREPDLFAPASLQRSTQEATE